MTIDTYDKWMHYIKKGIGAIILAFLFAIGVQWALGVCDITPKTIWFKGLFFVLMILFWAPWQKYTPRPKNAGNNDLFPE